MTYTIGDRKYALDAGWGKLPEGYEYNQVAGVAVDADDNVYAFNRSDHKLLVLDREGNLVKVWSREFDQPPRRARRQGRQRVPGRPGHARRREVQPRRGAPPHPGHQGPAVGHWRHRRGVHGREAPASPTTCPPESPRPPTATSSSRTATATAASTSSTLRATCCARGAYRALRSRARYQLPHGIGVDNEGQGAGLRPRKTTASRSSTRTAGTSPYGRASGSPRPSPSTTTAWSTCPSCRPACPSSTARAAWSGRWGGEESREPGRFVAPHCAAVDSEGSVYVGEVLEGARLQKFVRES